MMSYKKILWYIVEKTVLLMLPVVWGNLFISIGVLCLLPVLVAVRVAGFFQNDWLLLPIWFFLTWCWWRLYRACNRRWFITARLDSAVNAFVDYKVE